MFEKREKEIMAHTLPYVVGSATSSVSDSVLSSVSQAWCDYSFVPALTARANRVIGSAISQTKRGAADAFALMRRWHINAQMAKDTIEATTTGSS